MSLSDVLLQSANVLSVVALFVVGRKKRWGFLVWLVGEGCWAGWGYAAHSPGIYPWAAAWAAGNFWNWLSWRKRAVPV